MKIIRTALTLTLLACIPVANARSGIEHELAGPYDYDEHGKARPRFYTLDGIPYYSIDDLKRAVSHMPAHSKLFLHGGCQPYSTVELGPPPFVSLTAFKSFCRTRQIAFDWHSGR
jgi:hypothetical protein